MNGPMIGSKAFTESINFRSAEASASIPPGTPICFVMNATEDGFAAVLPSTAGATKCPSFFGGINASPIAVVPNAYGAAMVWGLCNYALVAQQSRAASTDNYASAAAFSLGQPLTINTVQNAFMVAAAIGAMTIVTGATTDTVAVNLAQYAPIAILAQTLAAAVSSASTTSDSSLKKTYGLKVFLRAM
jgi:hypothetical protein